MSKEVSELEQEVISISGGMESAMADPALTDTPGISNEPIYEHRWIPSIHNANEWNPDYNGYWGDVEVGKKYTYKSTVSEYVIMPCQQHRNSDIVSNIGLCQEKINLINSLISQFENLRQECEQSRTNLESDIQTIDRYISELHSIRGRIQDIVADYNNAKGQVHYIFSKSPKRLIAYCDSAANSCLDINDEQLQSAKGQLNGYKDRISAIIGNIDNYISQLNHRLSRCQELLNQESSKI